MTAPLPSGVLFITGTDTDVGKTVTTAAIAAALATRGLRVAIDKPTQTGVDDVTPGDVDEVRRLAGAHLPVTTGIRLRDPMAPVPAARGEHRVLPVLDGHIGRIRGLARLHDVVLVEGAGGLLVELTAHGDTIADLALALTPRPQVIVVTRPALGTLNHTLLTLEALATRQIPARGIVIGSWPEFPGAVDTNLDYLSRLRTPVIGRIPAGAAALPPAVFRSDAARWLSGLLS